MARNYDCTFCCAVCVVVLAFLVPSTSSTNSPDLHIAYSVAGTSRDIHTVVRNLKDGHLLRVKRQQPTTSAPSTPSPSNSSNNSSSSAVTPAPVANVTTSGIVTTSAPTSAPTTKKPTPRPSTAAPTTAAPTRPPTTTQRPIIATTKTPAQPQPPAGGVTTGRPPRPPGTTTPLPKFVQDNHNYYTSTILPDSADDYFIELSDPKTQGTLNSGHRLAVTVSLPFKFRFYGHNITNVTVATGGFVYMSPFLHQWLTATQYIAPLMANFDTSTSADSNIYYKQVGEEFVIEWHNVILKDQDAHGSFIFQTKLKSDGTIIFIYKTLPLPVQNISSTNHPVKIGLSDAFYNDTFLPQYGIKRRTIIEYHRVAFLKEQIEEGTVIILNPLPTCNIISDCGTCTQHTDVKFDCKWCDRVSRCSDGLDWYRQDWEKQGCKSAAIDNSTECNSSATVPTSTAALPPTTPRYNSSLTVTAPTTTTTKPVTIKPVSTTTTTNHPAATDLNPTQPTTVSPTKVKLPTTSMTAQPSSTTVTTIATRSHLAESTGSMPQTSIGAQAAKDDCRNSNDGTCKSGDKGSVAAVVAVVLVLLALLGSIAVWVFYAYTHPTSPSGIWLMEHRPSQMKAKLASMKFWKKTTPAGTKYAVESEA